MTLYTKWAPPQADLALGQGAWEVSLELVLNLGLDLGILR